MTAEFRNAFESYLALLQSIFSREDGSQFKSKIDAAEDSPEFSNLYARLEKDYAGGNRVISGVSRNLLAAFCRGSGLYVTVRRLEPPDCETWCERLSSEVQIQHETKTYIAPLEFFDSNADRIKCGETFVRKFSDQALSDILHNENNRIVYPGAYVDILQLSDYHFVVATEIQPRKLWKQELHLWNGKVKPFYSGFPKPIETALRMLSLWGWAARNPCTDAYPEWSGPNLPGIPFVLERSSSPFRSPGGSPDLRKLAKEPVFDDEDNEIGERRLSSCVVTPNAEDLGKFLADCVQMTAIVGSEKSIWKPVDAGLNFLVKGFTTSGIEQLLWHIAAIEAVFGDDSRSGTTKRLANRIANALGRTEEERQRLGKRFNQLYGYRSKLVHGSAASIEVHKGHLAEARDLARESVFWSLQFWADVARHLPNLQSVTRQAIITILDRPDEEWERLIPVLRMLPSRFAAYRMPGYLGASEDF